MTRLSLTLALMFRWKAPSRFRKVDALIAPFPSTSKNSKAALISSSRTKTPPFAFCGTCISQLTSISESEDHILRARGVPRLLSSTPSAFLSLIIQLTFEVGMLFACEVVSFIVEHPNFATSIDGPHGCAQDDKIGWMPRPDPGNYPACARCIFPRFRFSLLYHHFLRTVGAVPGTRL